MTLEKDLWRACDILRRDNNCGGVMEYVEHISWVLFLKFLDEQESEFETRANYARRPYERTVADEYRWEKWVGKALGEPVGEGMRTAPEWDGEELMRFVRGELIPHLASLSGSPEREVISGVFGERNVIVCASPYNLKDVLGIVDRINFESEDDVHTVSQFYEGLLRRLGQENKVAGEFYTPRSVVRFLVDIVDPKIGETVYDPACGSCGFLVEAHEHMRKQERTIKDHRVLQEKTFYGQEKKPIPALLGLMNMVLHGVRTPSVRRRNTLEENVTRGVSERFDVVLTNPPFGGTENVQIQNNFPVRANATELLFLQHISKKLHPRKGSRCGMVVPEGTLFRGGAFAAVKRQLPEDFDLQMIVSLPSGAFAPYSDVKTALLVFERSGPTQEVLFHELPLRTGLKKFSKGNPLSDADFAEAREAWKLWQRHRRDEGPRPEATSRTWIESAETLVARGYDLSAKNPNRPEEETPQALADITASLLENSRRLQEMAARLDTLVNSKELV
ncbi:N-6 DNA methylase [Rubrobacter tropicus]|uniref:site-specific DNA-methyltransferase (adenine-specific) n=1 Tax=Rubrobacter tropicus TaxID=2653851 RepID=A0A6G8Q529_9ACTN|nr:class I SAM-dependent DNA methyltransferase [Rubrobacter tropicus]QIN81582.1 N-6 DNA methylase [Rubrobacter tropicus]